MGCGGARRSPPAGPGSCPGCSQAGISGESDLGHLVEAGYGRGVPMGAELPARPAGSAAPTFLVHAAKDALGANLDRIQIVKCWTARGMLFEKVFDVAASDGRTRDPRTGHLPPVGSTVDISTATYRNDIGATELSAAWTDPGVRRHAGVHLLRAHPRDPHAALVHL